MPHAALPADTARRSPRASLNRFVAMAVSNRDSSHSGTEKLKQICAASDLHAPGSAHRLGRRVPRSIRFILLIINHFIHQRHSGSSGGSKSDKK